MGATERRKGRCEACTRRILRVLVGSLAYIPSDTYLCTATRVLRRASVLSAGILVLPTGSRSITHLCGRCTAFCRTTTNFYARTLFTRTPLRRKRTDRDAVRHTVATARTRLKRERQREREYGGRLVPCRTTWSLHQDERG